LAQAIFEPNLFPYKYPNILNPSHSSYLPAYEDGTDRVFKSDGIQNSDAVELPRSIQHSEHGEILKSRICMLLAKVSTMKHTLQASHNNEVNTTEQCDFKKLRTLSLCTLFGLSSVTSHPSVSYCRRKPITLKRQILHKHLKRCGVPCRNGSS
jgi:hypothetical protein